MNGVNRKLAVEAYGLGHSDMEVAEEFGVSPHTVRRWASEAGVKRGGLAPQAYDDEADARQAFINAVGFPPPEYDPADVAFKPNPNFAARARRCRNRDCDEEFIPVNAQHWYHEPACAQADDKKTVPEILSEEGGFDSVAAPYDLAQRAFGQKNQVLREVRRLTSQREYLSNEVRRYLKEDPGAVYAPYPEPPPAVGSRTGREVVLVCSDWQLGKLEGDVGVREVVGRRIPRIREATLQIIENVREAGHAVNKVHLVFAGDMIEGCYIYGGQNVTGLDRTGNTHRLVKQIHLCAAEQAQLAMALAAHVPEVVVHSVPGNHGRPNGRNDFADPADNFDTMAIEWARDKAAAQENITWQVEDDWFTSFDSMGHQLVVIHGDQWRQGFEQLERLLPKWVTAGEFGIGKPDVFITAHRHSFKMADINGITVVQNGTIDGGSRYFSKATGITSQPEQTVLVMSEKHAVENIWPIYFDRSTNVLSA